MDTVQENNKKISKPHVVCIPFPTQGHINPMHKLSVLFHAKGFHVTFVNTERNHRRLLSSGGHATLRGSTDFVFRAVPDGLPPGDDVYAAQDVPALCFSTAENCLGPLLELLEELKREAGTPPVTCIVTDAIMMFALDAAEEIGVPGVLLRTASACSGVCYWHIPHLMDKGLVPLPDESCLTNGYLNTIIDWIPGLIKLRLGDFPFIHTTDPDDKTLKFCISESYRAPKASAIIVNTLRSLEQEALDSLSRVLPPIYPIGPLHLLCTESGNSNSRTTSLWKEDDECIKWLDAKEENSVLYVNFGSLAVLTPEELAEFAWGLANSKKSFLWIIRHDMVVGEKAVLPQEFLEEIKDRGMISRWCRQEEVLGHRAVAGFLTHCGWNSMLEGVSHGVLMVCWAFFADQQVNCRYACDAWGFGAEVGVGGVRRKEVEQVVREVVGGEKGKKMKTKAMEWKREAEEATRIAGESWLNLDNVIKDVLTSKS